jgi:protein-S-isoprenylcysteine O-methyltransferase Ste14
MYIGAAALVGQRGPVLVFPALAALLRKTVVQREERYPAERFGEGYHQCQAHVPRWL